MSKQSNQRYRKESEERLFSESPYGNQSSQDRMDDEYEDDFDDEFVDDYEYDD